MRVGLSRRIAISLTVWLFAALIVGAGTPAAAKYASLVVDAETGQVLHQINPDTRNYPASLTKIMTLYMVFDALKNGRLTLEDRMKVSRRATGQPPSRLGLRRGQTITVRDAILALVTKSANDVATVVAEHLGGTERKFAVAMTAKARELGMVRTTFRNASGLPNRGQLTTARDMSRLARAMLRDFPVQYRVFSTQKFRWHGVNFRNHNKLLGRYEGLDGIKTGYIRASGFNLVASAERGGRRLVGVVMGGRSPSHRNTLMAKLLDESFRELESTLLAESGLNNGKRRRTLVSARGSGSGSWGIQVGAFRAYDPALRETHSAVDLVPTLLEDGRIIVARSKKGGSKAYYLARIVNIGRQEARRACSILKKRKRPCMALKVKQTVVAAAPARGSRTLAPAPPKPERATSADASADVGSAPVIASTEESSSDGAWGVQVGAYRSSEPALRQANEARRTASKFLSSGRVLVVRHTNGNRRPFYLSQIHGLSETEARLACRTLKRARTDCMTMRLRDDAVTTAAATPTAPSSTGEKQVAGAWGVQVGAYPEYRAALNMATRALKIASGPLAEGVVKVVPLTKGKRRPLYRARILGITKSQAYNACRQLGGPQD